jgi:single-strand DNA-binding protein
MSVNKVILIGNVGKDPEVNYIKEDLPVARFSLATSESYTKDGQKVTNTEWHNIVVWRGLAKVVENYVKKGSKLYIEGKISNRQYEKDGQTKYISEIVVNNMEMLDSKPSGATNESASSIPPPPPPTGDTSDDLPF